VNEDGDPAFQGQVVYSDNTSADSSVTLRRGSPDDDNSFVRQNTANHQGSNLPDLESGS